MYTVVALRGQGFAVSRVYHVNSFAKEQGYTQLPSDREDQSTKSIKIDVSNSLKYLVATLARLRYGQLYPAMVSSLFFHPLL